MSWRGWEKLGGVLTSGPGVCSWGPGRLDVFVRGIDNGLWHKWFRNGWSGWENLGGVLTSSPAAVSWGGGRIDVFARGTDNGLLHRSFQDGWGEWESIGGVMTADPAVCSRGAGRLEVFMRGTDNALWQRSYHEGAWGGWKSLGGVLTTAPAAASSGPGRIDVFAAGIDGALWRKRHRNGWSGWENLGGVLTSAPSASSWEPGRLDVFVRGSANQMLHKWDDGGWSAWESLGGALTSAPAAVSWGPDRIDTFVRGTDNALWHKWWAIVPTVRLHAKILTAPGIAIPTMVERMKEVYASAGIAVQLVSTEVLNFPLLDDVDVGRCTMGKTTDEQEELFDNRASARPNDVVVYFVRSTVPPYNGCAAFPKRQPGAVVVQGATQWTLAHEVGHVLGLRHVDDNDRLMTGKGTGNITNPPPNLVASEVATMLASPYTQDV